MLIILTLLALVSGILILWLSTFYALENARLDFYYPLVLFAASLLLLAAIFFYELLLSIWDVVFVVFYVISLVWILCAYVKLINNGATERVK